MASGEPGVEIPIARIQSAFRIADLVRNCVEKHRNRVVSEFIEMPARE
jgi:hypothetical protein